MAQPVELILIRHLASRLAIPVFVVDGRGDLVYFNERAEPVLGRRFDEIRSMPFDEWTTAFLPTSGDRPMSADELPLVIALRQGIPAHRHFAITGSDQVERTIDVSAFPIVAADDRLLGAVAMFWEASGE